MLTAFAVRRTRDRLEDPRTKHATACCTHGRYVAGEIKVNRAWLPNDGYYLLSEKLIAL